jgi:integrase
MSQGSAREMQQMQEPSASLTDGQGWGSGHVSRVERQAGPAWYAKYRLPDGRQVQKKIGPAWTGRGRPPAGFFTKRTAEAWLRDALQRAREGDVPAPRGAVVTFATAAREWLRYVADERGVKPSTLRSYRSSVEAHLVPAFGSRPIDRITTGEIERWRSGLDASARTKNKLLVELHGIFRRAQKAYGLRRNPAAEVEKLRERRRVDLEVYSPEEVHALVRAAGSEQDAAIFLTAAFTGLRRGELIALRWRDVDFAAHAIRVTSSYAGGRLTTPKLGGYLCGSALRRRYVAALGRAGLRQLRFHDLRHTFGTRVIAHADILRVQEWMGHADVQTTMRYLHFAPRAEDAAIVAAAFATETRALPRVQAA